MFEVEKSEEKTLEYQETFRAAKAMSEDEQRIALKAMDADLIWDEMKRRFDYDRNMVADIRALVKVKDV